MIKKRAIFSDAGGILFDDVPRNAEELTFILANTDVDPLQFKRDFYSFKMRAQTDSTYSRVNAFLDYLHKIGRSDLEDVYKVYHATQEENRPDPRRLVYADTLPLLTDLHKRGIPFVVISDGTRSAAESRTAFYDPAGISPYLTDLVLSKDVGAKKPDARIFDYALAKHGLRKEDVIFVAHDYDELKGGADYGFMVAAIRYKPEMREHGHLDFVTENGVFLNSLTDLLDLVE